MTTPRVAPAGASRTFEVAASRRIAAPPEAVYAVFTDYLDAHARILPRPFFVGMTVVEGGHGAGTVIDVTTHVAGRTRVMRGIASEPEPGRLLVENYPADRTVTSFRVDPAPGGLACTVTIATEMPRRRGPVGWLEERFARRLLRRVYTEELALVARYVA